MVYLEVILGTSLSRKSIALVLTTKQKPNTPSVTEHGKHHMNIYDVHGEEVSGKLDVGGKDGIPDAIAIDSGGSGDVV